MVFLDELSWKFLSITLFVFGKLVRRNKGDSNLFFILLYFYFIFFAFRSMAIPVLEHLSQMLITKGEGEGKS